MARIRSIKPEFWESEALGTLPVEARLLFIGLVSHADDDGRQRGNPAFIAKKVFPYDETIGGAEVAGWLGLLEGIDVVIRYEVEGQKFLQVTNFCKHQRINRKTDSVIPSPHTHGALIASSVSDPGDGASGREGKGEEGSGGEGKSQPDGSDAPLTTVVDRPEVTRLCNLLADTIAQDGTPRPDVGAGWLTDCRRLLDIDGATVEQVEYVIGWAHSPGNFWAANILSMRKLREKWTQMVKQINRDRASSSVAPTDTLRGWAVDAA
jgi:hypothetical protein